MAVVDQLALFPDATSPCAGEGCAGRTTTSSPATDSIAAFVAGFVAGEGTFTRSGESFTFAVQLGATDAASCDAMLAFFNVGQVGRYKRRKAHYDDVATFYVRKTKDLVETVIPFMDAHLPRSYKRSQYEPWREALTDYWEHRARRRRPCTIAGCDRIQRAHGVCRHHLYEIYGV